MKEQTTVAEFNNGWKGRGNLQNMVAELERQKQSRIDFVADTRQFQFVVRKGENKVANDPKTKAPNVPLILPVGESVKEWLTDGAVGFTRGALMQVAEKCEPSIPKRFFDALVEGNPERAESLVNGLHQDSPSKRLVRCLDGRVRGWLSDKYRVIDNFDMAFTCMDAAQRSNGQVIEAGLSDTHMRIKFTSQSVWDAIDIQQRSGPQGGWYAGAIGNRELIGKTVLGATIRGELPGGPGTIHPVITVSNSETGHGSFRVRLGILMGICYNVATLEDVVSNVHLGERLQEGIYTQETISAESKAIMLKARDGVTAAFDPEKFKRIVAKAKAAQSKQIENASSAVENVIETHQIPTERKEALLEYFLKDYDKTQFGLAQAVSRLAQDTDDADEADGLEAIAGKLLTVA